MRLPEQRFWDRTRPRLTAHFLVERVENLVGVGTPDIWVLAPTGRVTPVELKAVQGWPARLSTRVLGPKAGLSQDQKNWHLTWQQAGGRSAILVGVGGNQQFLFPGHACDLINEFSRHHFENLAQQSWDRIVLALNNGWTDI